MPVLGAVVAVSTAVATSTAAAATGSGASPSASPATTGTAAHQLPATLKAEKLPTSGPVTVMLELNAEAAAAAYGDAIDAGQSVAAADATSRAQTQTVKSLASSVEAHFGDPTTKASPLFTTHAAYAGIAVTTDASKLPALAKIPGVLAVHRMPVKKVDNTVTVPLIKAPQAWQFAGTTGKGVRIGIIDTGIDYTHADFGGPGTVAAYTAAKAADAGPFHPTAKVAGGFDFVGDDYDADPTDPTYQPVPHPDPNPLGCDSHGTHVAGTAAGYGENANGTTYKGPYNTSTPFSTMKIGPGVAPEATLYALKVFGCNGSTNVVSLALDWAVDPNGDGNVSDHLDVVNMSLGSDFGSPEDPDSVASNNISKAGVVVVAAAGNGGDLFDIGGSPGNAERVIGVAASDDSTDWLDGLRVNSPASVAGIKPVEYSQAYDFVGKPDVTGDLYKLTDPANQDGCLPYSAADKAAVAGKIAWLEWTDNDTLRACGSATRANNAAAAGAIGVVNHDDEDRFAAGLAGNALIPEALMTKTAGDTLIAAGIDGINVTFSNSLKLATKLVNPAFTDEVVGFSSRGVTENGIGKPDVSAPGNTILSAGLGTGNGGLNDSGTSMATPHTAGLAALVVQAHPTWSAERIKAAIVNTATQDVFAGPGQTGTIEGPERAGAGRIVANAAVMQQVVAYNQTDHGAVGVSFGDVEVAPTASLSKVVRVQNLSNSWATYHVAYDAVTTVPGVNIATSTSSISVAPHAASSFKVTLTAQASQMTHNPDPAIDTTTDLGGGVLIPRQFIPEASGRVVLTPTQSTGGSVLRVPVYSAPRPTSVMTQPSKIALQLQHNGTLTGNVPLSGFGFDNGTGANEDQSLVSGFALQGTSGKLPACTATVITGCVPFSDERAADLKAVGTTADGTSAYFAINTWGEWHTPASYVEFDVLIDTNNDGTPDLDLFNSRLTGTDVFVSELIDLNTGDVLDNELLNVADGSVDTNMFNSDTLVMPVAIAALGGTPGHTQFKYVVESQTVYGTTDAIDHWMTFDPVHPAVQLEQNGQDNVLYNDLPGHALTVVVDPRAAVTDDVTKMLVVHYLNGAGNRAQIVEAGAIHR
jgi:subtilisin family serine protease